MFAAHVAAVALAAAIAAGAQTPSVKLDAEAGLGGFARAGTAATVRVRLASDGEADGVVRVVVGEEDEHAVPYEVPVTLAPGARKAVTVPVWMPRGCACVVEFALRDGRVLAQAEPSVTDLHDEPLLAVVGPSSLGLPIAGLAAPQGVRCTLVSPQDLPRHWAGLEPLSLLALEDRQWEALEEEQRDAACDWVEHGGQLLLGLSDPTLARTSEAITRWAGRKVDLRAEAGPPPQVDLSPLGWPQRAGAPGTAFAAQRVVGEGRVTLLGISRAHPMWPRLFGKDHPWDLFVAMCAARRRNVCGVPHARLDVEAPGVAAGAAYFFLLGLAGGAVLIWRLVYVRRRIRDGTWRKEALPSRVSLTTVSFAVVLPLGVWVGLSWRPPASRTVEETLLHRGPGCARWAVDTSLRLDSRWGARGEVDLDAANGVLAYGGPQVDDVRSPWRRGASRDDAVRATSHPSIPSLRSRGGDRLVLAGKGFLACPDLDALALQFNAGVVTVGNEGRLTLRSVWLRAGGRVSRVDELKPGDSISVPYAGTEPPTVILKGECPQVLRLWTVPDAFGPGAATINFERTWP